MSRSPSEKFWSLACSVRELVVVLWSVCLLFFVISALLLVTGATDQDPILVVNLFVLAPPLVLSAVILAKCSDR